MQYAPLRMIRCCSESFISLVPMKVKFEKGIRTELFWCRSIDMWGGVQNMPASMIVPIEDQSGSEV